MALVKMYGIFSLFRRNTIFASVHLLEFISYAWQGFTNLRICFTDYFYRILLNLMNNDSKKDKEKDEHHKPEDKNSVYENSHTKIT